MKKMEDRIKELEYENDMLRKANHNLTEQLDMVREEKKDSIVDLPTSSLLTMKKELEEVQFSPGCSMNDRRSVRLP